MTALKDRPQRSVFATLGPMYRSNDDKAWKAARKAGFRIHKTPLTQGDESLFLVFIKEPNGYFEELWRLYTAKEVIREAAKEEPWAAHKPKPKPPRRIDVSCVSTGL